MDTEAATTMTKPKNQNSFHTFFSTDRPIETRSNDRLGRARFAEAIADAIRGWFNRDSLVIALYGPWGMGKSSIKNMVLDTFRSDRQQNVVAIEYNPWRFANRDQTQAAFFDQVGIALDKGEVGTQRTRARLLAKWQRYAAYLTAGKSIVDLVQKPVGAILFIIAAATAIAKGAGVPLGSGYWVEGVLGGIALLFLGSSRVAEAVTGVLRVGLEIGRKSLDEVKEDLSTELRTVEKPILIIIDDVDRLTPKETLALLQLVKANVDLPNIVFLLLCDRTVVGQHIQSLLKVSGNEFLEKVVQIGFDVPKVERPRMLRVLTDGLNEIMNADKNVEDTFDQVRWGNIFVDGIDGYFQNLRHVNRFLATLAFHVALFRAKVAFEVNIVDLIALEAVRMFEPDLYQALPRHKTYLTAPDASLSQNDEPKARALKALLEKVSEERRDRITRIVKELFPLAESALGGSSYESDFAEEWERGCRVCSTNFFDRYFHFAIPQGDVSQDIVHGLLAQAGDHKALVAELQSLKTRGELELLLDRLEAYKQTIEPDHRETFVRALFDIGDDIGNEMTGLFSLSPLLRLTRIAYWCMRGVDDPKARSQAMLRIVKESSGVLAPANFVSIEQQRHEKQKDATTEMTLTSEDLESAKTLCVIKIEQAATDGGLSALEDLPWMLFRWKDWKGIDGPRKYVSEVSNNPEGALSVLRRFVQRSTTHGIDDKVSRTQWFASLKYLEEFVDLESFREQIESIAVSSCTDEEQQALKAFSEALDRRMRGEPD